MNPTDAYRGSLQISNLEIQRSSLSRDELIQKAKLQILSEFGDSLLDDRKELFEVIVIEGNVLVRFRAVILTSSQFREAKDDAASDAVGTRD